MNAVICSVHRVAIQPAQTPITPALGARTPQRLQQAKAFSLYSGEPQPQGPFSFLHPEIPVEGKPEKQRSRVASFAKPAEEEQRDFQTTPGQPRFRSALEQVSYFTNESAMRQK